MDIPCTKCSIAKVCSAYEACGVFQSYLYNCRVENDYENCSIDDLYCKEEQKNTNYTINITKTSI